MEDDYDYKRGYEIELARRRKAEERLQTIKDAIWLLIEDDLYEQMVM